MEKIEKDILELANSYITSINTLLTLDPELQQTMKSYLDAYDLTPEGIALNGEKNIRELLIIYDDIYMTLINKKLESVTTKGPTKNNY